MAEKKGRPPKSSENYSVIRDPLMEPFYIQKDSTNYTVFQANLNPKPNSIDKVVGYYTQFSNALNKIAREKYFENAGEYESIKEYIADYKKLKDGIHELLKDLEI